MTATLIGVLVVGPYATFVEYPKVLSSVRPDGNPVNAPLPGAAARIFGGEDQAHSVASLPWAVPAAVVLGWSLVLLTTWAVRKDEGGLGLWAAASFLASPVAWHNYLVVLAPGIFVLVGRGHTYTAMLLLTLVLIPPPVDRDVVGSTKRQRPPGGVGPKPLHLHPGGSLARVPLRSRSFLAIAAAPHHALCMTFYIAREISPPPGSRRTATMGTARDERLCPPSAPRPSLLWYWTVRSRVAPVPDDGAPGRSWSGLGGWPRLARRGRRG